MSRPRRRRQRIRRVSGTAVLVVGGGLAGSEAAWQLAEAGIDVVLAEMRPVRPTPVHGGSRLAELVCSNSLRGDAPTNAVGVLKAEMEVLDSLILRIARQAAVPAGGALAVDRDIFARGVTAATLKRTARQLRPRLPTPPKCAVSVMLLKPMAIGAWR